MQMETIISLIIGITTAVAIFLIQEQRRRKLEVEAKRFRAEFKKLEERNRADAWHLYRTSYHLWAKIEKLKEKFDEIIGEKKDSDLILQYGSVGEIHGIVVVLSRDTIRLIKQSEVEFTDAKIQQWVEEKKIPNEYQKEQFTVLLRS